VIKCDPKALKAAIDEYEIAIDRQIDLKVAHHTHAREGGIVLTVVGVVTKRVRDSASC
jgi:hypothetical protein